MTGTRDSLGARIGDLPITGAIRRRIIASMLPLLLMLPRRANVKQMAIWGDRNEGTYHNWFKQELGLDDFNRSLANRHGTGDCFVIFAPSFLPKSGKKSPGLGRFWSGQAGAVKRGLEIGCFAVGDLGHGTAFHLSAKLTPSVAELRKAGKTLMQHYVSQVEAQAGHIAHFGNCLAVDGYFGVGTFVGPVVGMGICLVSCLKSNAALFYAPLPRAEGAKPGKGRPRKKDGKVDWANLDEGRLPVVYEDGEKRVRCGLVYVKCLKRL